MPQLSQLDLLYFLGSPKTGGTTGRLMINHWFLGVYTAGVRFAVPGAVEVLFIGLPAFSEKKWSGLA